MTNKFLLLTNERFHIHVVVFLVERIKDATGLGTASIGIEVHVSQGLHGAEVEDDASLSVSVHHVNKHSVTGRETDVGVVLALKPWSSGVHT